MLHQHLEPTASAGGSLIGKIWILFSHEVPLPSALKIKYLLIQELQQHSCQKDTVSYKQDLELNPCTGVQFAEGSAALTSLEFSIHIFVVVSAEITLAEGTGMLSLLYLGDRKSVV